jgi:glycosyltransferase involved in cell wall biosynthesis
MKAHFKMVDIAVVRSGIYDARIVKVIRSLSKQHSAVFLGWNREGISYEIRKEMLHKNFHNNLHLNFKILNMKAPFAKQFLRCYIPMILYFPLFWSWVFVNLAIFKPKVVHAFDLDTVLPCYIYKKLFRKKLVFDIADRYAMTFIPKKHHMLYSTLNCFEEAFSKRADVLITLAENVLESFRKKPNKTAVILNCPEDYSSNKGIKEDGIFVLGYGGPISKGRGLEYVAAALSNLSKVKLYVYGQIIDKELFDTINRLSNVEYKGLLRIYDDYHKTIVLTDTIIAIYTKETPSHHITMHNKHLEAMMGGIPIITNLSPEFVNEIGFGIIVEYGNVDQIKSAITRLRDDSEMRKRLGNNGRKAFLEKYNWGIMEKKLYDVYDNLL